MSLADELHAAPTTNPYLSGNYAPVTEEVTATDLEVTGTLPLELDGLLLRDGPNPFGPVAENHHWFLGHGMIHGVRLADGRAESYRNRWIRSDRFAEASGLPAAPLAPVRSMLPGLGGVNVIGHAGAILGLGEVGLPWRMSPTLETEGEHDFAGAISTNVTAHPKVDPVTGELVFFGYDFGPIDARVHVADAAGRVVHSVDVTTPAGPTMMHDFAVTETRIVLMDLPVVFDLDVVAQGRMMPFRWDPSHGARLGVMPRRAGSDADIRWVELDPCYVFHVFNAYDDGDRIVMDVVRYPKMFDVDLLGPAEDVLASVVRWTVDPVAGTVSVDEVDERTQEFPRVDPRVETRRHRFGYSVDVGAGFTFGDVIKRDFTTDERWVHELGAGRHSSEAVFVPRSPDSAEDDGWLLSVVYDESTDRSDVVVLDATDVAAPPVATVHLPVRVPYGFHGNWVPTA